MQQRLCIQTVESKKMLTLSSKFLHYDLPKQTPCKGAATSWITPDDCSSWTAFTAHRCFVVVVYELELNLTKSGSLMQPITFTSAIMLLEVLGQWSTVNVFYVPQVVLGFQAAPAMVCLFILIVYFIMRFVCYLAPGCNQDKMVCKLPLSCFLTYSYSYALSSRTLESWDRRRVSVLKNTRN